MTWNDIYCQTSHSSTYRYFPNWFNIHSRNNTMSIKEIRPVYTQTCSKLFTLALGTDTAKNSSLTLHDFPRLGVRLDLPQIILTNMKPVVASFVWYKEGHFLEPPQLNGVPSLPTLLHPRTLTTNYYELLSRFMIIFWLTRIVGQDDPLYNLVPESMRAPQQEDVVDSSTVDDVKQTQEPSAADDVKPDDLTLDFDSHLLVMGVLQLQLLQLPIQPRRFSDWTVALRKFSNTFKLLIIIAGTQLMISKCSRGWRRDQNLRVSRVFLWIGSC